MTVQSARHLEFSQLTIGLAQQRYAFINISIIIRWFTSWYNVSRYHFLWDACFHIALHFQYTSYTGLCSQRVHCPPLEIIVNDLSTRDDETMVKQLIPFATSPSLLSPGWRRNNLSKLPQPGNNWRNINGNCRPGLGTWNLWWEITRDLLILCTLTPLPGCQCQVTYIRLVKWLFAQVCWRKSGRGDWRLKSQWVRCQNTLYLVPSPLQVLKAHSALMNMCAVILISLPTASSMGRRSSTSAHMTWWQPRWGIGDNLRDHVVLEIDIINGEQAGGVLQAARKAQHAAGPWLGQVQADGEQFWPSDLN